MQMANMSKTHLTKALADFRHAIVRQGTIHYHLGLNFKDGSYFDGVVEITFGIDKNVVLPIDYRGQVKGLSVNGNQVQFKNLFNGARIVLDQHLVMGENKVRVQFTSKYSNDQGGCKTYRDSDGRQYLSTCFQPYYANLAFPSFDQPNLKAYFKLDATAPEKWIVLSGESTHEDQIKEGFVEDFLAKTGREIHRFRTSALLPTYLFSFSAGQYFCLQRNPAQSYKNLNTNLYCHQSMSPYLVKHSALLWQLTDHGLEHYESSYGYAYPFSKFQVLFFGDFSIRAMENPGLIVFQDSYLFKQEVGQQLMVDLAETFLHQMAHCWFGDLVTMNWWNDLWLNQSFADYAGFLCLQRIKHKVTAFQYQTAMISFLRRKQWGYLEDSYSNNHPVRCEINDTDQALTLFDGITYSKGGSILKNIVFLIGEDKFSLACREYFQRYAWKNTEYKDFTDCLQMQFEVKQFQFGEWKQQWLQTKGHNRLQVQRTGNGEIVIHQTLGLHCESLKSYKLNLSTFYQGVKTTVPIILRNVPSSTFKVGNQAQAFLLNDGDHCFVEVILDAGSFRYFSTTISATQDSLTRTMLWIIFFNRVKSGASTFTQYLQLVASEIQHEHNVSVLECVFEQIAQVIDTYLNHFRARHPLREVVFDLSLVLLSKNTDLQKRKVILQCLIASQSQRMLPLFLENKIGDNLEQKYQIAQQLLRICDPQQREQVMETFVGKATGHFDKEEKELKRTYSLIEKSREQRTIMLITQLMDEAASFSKAEVSSICQTLKSDSFWYKFAHKDYIVRLREMIPTSQRQDYISSILVSFCESQLTEPKIQIYESLLPLTHGKAYLNSRLLKLTEDHRRHLKVRV